MNRRTHSPLAALVRHALGCMAVAPAIVIAQTTTDACWTGGGRYDDHGSEHQLTPGNCNVPDRAPRPIGVRNAEVGGIVVEVERDGLPADGQTPTRIRVKLYDAARRPLDREAIVTVETTGGRLQLPDRPTDETGPARGDLDRIVPGTQVRVEKGEASFLLIAPAQAQDVRIRVTAGRHQAEGVVSFLPDLREMIAVGVVEGIVSIANRSNASTGRSDIDDGLERELRHFNRSFNDGRGRAGASSEFFLKGVVKGEYLLTMAYDSDKARQSRLFRDIRPDEFYPIFGDASEKGFDARSTQKLFLRIDRDKSYLLFGDFNTASTYEAQQLGQYARTLTGLRHHYENRGIVIDSFASRDTTRQVIDEMPARGISGPYFASNLNGVRNSERVEIVTRDRNQPSLILKTTPMQRFVDYTFEPFAGQVVFKGPVPTFDENFNPNTVRITYEVDNGGDQFWVGGVSGRVRLGDSVEVGGSYVDDDNPAEKYQLRSLNTRIRLGETTTIIAETANSERNVFNEGRAYRAEIRHLGSGLQLRAVYGRSDIGFYNPAAPLQPGREEFNARATYDLTRETQVFVEALKSEDLASGGERRAGQVGVGHWITDRLRGEIGLRRAEDRVAAVNAYAGGNPNVPTTLGFTPFQVNASSPLTPVPQLSDTTSMNGRLTYRLTDRSRLFGEYERDIHDADKHRHGLGADYQIAERTRLYGRHDWLTGASGPYGIQQTGNRTTNTVVGVDTSYSRDGQMFSEYRLRDAISGEDSQAAMGLRHTWTLAPGVRTYGAFERVHAISGRDVTATGVAGGVEFVGSPLWKSSARLDLRQDPIYNTALSTLAYTRKLNDDWSFIARNYLNVAKARTDEFGDRWQDRAQLGVALRPVDTNVWNALARYEYKVERDSTPSNPSDRRVHIASTHGTYHPARPLWINGRAATKWLSEEFGGLASKYRAHLLGGRAIYDITERWDVGVAAFALFSPQGASRAYSSGVEVGYLLAANLWLSLGYNWNGFSDRDLSASEYTQQGVYLRLRFKFDEDLFSSRNPDINRSLPRPAP